MNRDELAVALEAARITGEVATTREDNMLKIQRFIDHSEHEEFGVTWTQEWDADSVFALMVERVGINPEPSHVSGQDTIGTALAVAKLEEYAAILGERARAGARILFATGHPGGLLPVYAELAEAARKHGAEVIAIPEGLASQGGHLRQIMGVKVCHKHGSLLHSHSPEHMRLVLEWMSAHDVALPDLVVADHGWAGAAADAGIETIGIADCNDPGLFVSEEQGQLRVAVPIDDNVHPGLYRPMIDFILERARLS